MTFADFVVFSESDLGEKNGLERVETVRNGVVGTLYQSARLRKNPRNYADLRKKIPTGNGWDLGYWWRRRESNPRPQILGQSVLHA